MAGGCLSLSFAAGKQNPNHQHETERPGGGGRMGVPQPGHGTVSRAAGHSTSQETRSGISRRALEREGAETKQCMRLRHGGHERATEALAGLPHGCLWRQTSKSVG